MGKKIATTAVLLIKAVIGPTINPITKICWLAVVPPHFSNQSRTVCTTPVFVIPALKINIAMTVIVAGLPNPDMPSSGVTNFKSIKTTVTVSAVKSTGSHSKMKAIKARITILRVRTMFVM